MQKQQTRVKELEDQARALQDQVQADVEDIAQSERKLDDIDRIRKFARENGMGYLFYTGYTSDLLEGVADNGTNVDMMGEDSGTC